MGSKRLLAVLVALILGTGSAWAQNFGAPLDRYFRLDWEVERAKGGSPRITGYLHNDRLWWVVKVRLLVEALDPSGRVVSTTGGYIGDVPPAGRVSFDIAAPSGGASYRVSIESFDWLPGGPSG